MAEYYAVLSKAVAGLDVSSPESRRAVYDKARNALIGQLKAIDPPLPTADISRQRLELEEAIRRVEREALAVPAGAVKVARSAVVEPAASGAAAPPPSAAPARAAPPPPATPLRRSPQDVFRRAIQDAEKGTVEEEPQLERAPAAAKVDTSWASERIDRVPPPARPQQSYLPSQGYVEKEEPSDEPRLAPDYDQEWSQTVPEPGGVVPPMGEDERTAKPRRGRRGGRGGHDARETSVRSSRLPSVVLLVLILAMLGGLGALAWSQRDVLADLAAGILPPSDTDTPTMPEAATAASAPVAEDAAGKDTESLLSGGAPSPSADIGAVDPADGEPVGQQLASTAPGAPAAPAEPVPEQEVLVAQRAVLYEEPLDPEAAAAGVVAINAAVTWSYLPDGINGPEIVGRIDVPERGLKVKLAIRRNTDQTLPASHIVEVVVDAPGDFPGQGVRDVPRIVFKPSEDARGQPLIGASARVADGFFWIALSGIDSDVRVNEGLLRERIWIDLPLVYETGQRAILTLEKGAPGERVFDRALMAWTG
jgi:hypothetical protein